MGYNDLNARSEAKKLQKSVRPLTALLLLKQYSIDDLAIEIEKLDSGRQVYGLISSFHQIARLLNNQREKIYQAEKEKSHKRFEETHCNFDQVLEILGLTRGTVEKLIDDKEITAIQHKKGGKRSFVIEHIIKYRDGLQEKKQMNLDL